MTIAAGARFGHYHILSPLSAGAIGEVYAARDTRLDCDVIRLPVIRTRIEIQRGVPDKTIQLLRSVSPYERAALFWSAYTRCQAYLRLRAGTEAETEFHKILDNIGQDPTSFLYPHAHLGLARSTDHATGRDDVGRTDHAGICNRSAAVRGIARTRPDHSTHWRRQCAFGMLFRFYS